ncbi:MAG: stage V sporulation protein D [Lysinibacillus sp.]
MKWISTHSKKRLRVLYVLFILTACAIFLRLVFVQIINNKELTEKAEANWDREIPFANERGHIIDRNGEVIVSNRLTPTLYFMPSQNDNVEEAASKIAEVLGVKPDGLLEKMKQKANLVKLAPEGKNISYEKAVEIQGLQIDGLYSGVDYSRYYPQGALLSRFLGFTGYDSQGLAGVEYEYDKYLQGNSSAIRLFTDAKGKNLSNVDSAWKAGKDGATVELTIDMQVQKVVERELSQAMKKYDADQAFAIAMNPNTGEILALSSYPTYHPEQYSKVDPAIYNRNLPVWMAFEPGSTFKIITLSAALEENVVDLEKEHFYDPGFTMVAGARLRCWKREGHKDETYLEVVENSCNPGFIEMGQRVGSKKLMKYIKDFGFGKVTGSNIAGESSGILFSEEGFGPVEHATTSFGQGISVTPIQQVQAVAAAINGGKLYTPYVVKEIVDPKTKEVLAESKTTMKRQVIREDTSKKVREALESVVANGSGRHAFREGLRIGGKTGTAQKVENGRYKDGEYIVSFIGFAPADNPQIVVYVAIDNPKKGTQFGGVIAAPIVGQIIEDTAKHVGIKKSTKQLEKEYRYGDPLTVRTPDLIGQTADDIAKQYYPFRIEWHGEGTKIGKQLPEPNAVIEQDGIIHVYLTK